MPVSAAAAEEAGWAETAAMVVARVSDLAEVAAGDSPGMGAIPKAREAVEADLLVTAETPARQQEGAEEPSAMARLLWRDQPTAASVARAEVATVATTLLSERARQASLGRPMAVVAVVAMAILTALGPMAEQVDSSAVAEGRRGSGMEEREVSSEAAVETD